MTCHPSRVHKLVSCQPLLPPLPGLSCPGSCSRFPGKPGVTHLCPSSSAPSAWQALPSLLGPAPSPSFCRSLPGTSREPPWSSWVKPWVGGFPSGPYDGFSQWPGQPLTQIITGGGRQAAGIRRWASCSQVSTRGRDSILLPPSQSRKDAASVTPLPCPRGPAGQLGHLLSTAVLQQREISHLGEWGGDIPDGTTSTLVTGTRESGSPWLLPSTWPQT